jgi:pimeloyl-ACP methyl ester carboxylesterase
MLGFRSHHVETDHGRVHVLDSGGERTDLTPLVLLHGLSACAADYGPVLKHLRSSGRRLVVPDLPGHGLSGPLVVKDFEAARESLSQALAQVIDRPAVFFGNSLGGFAGVRYANEQPDRVSGLMLSSPGGAPIAEHELEGILEHFRPGDLAKARAFVDTVAGRSHWSHGILAWGARVRFEQPGVRDLLHHATTDDLLAPHELSGLEMPVLFVWGQKERLFGPEQYEFFRRHLPGHTAFEEPENFGHAPFLGQARTLAERIEEFVSELAE